MKEEGPINTACQTLLTNDSQCVFDVGFCGAALICLCDVVFVFFCFCPFC